MKIINVGKKHWLSGKVKVLYNKGFFFYINHLSLIIFYHSVWLGFELFGLRVHVHSYLVVLRACTTDMTITLVIINPRQEMWLECDWHHARKRWLWEFKDFEKERAGKLTLDHGGWEVSFLPLSWELRLTVERCSCNFRISTDWDPKHRKMHRALVGSA